MGIPSAPRHISGLRQLFQLVIGERSPTFQRVITALVSTSMILLGWDPLLNPTDTAYDRPIFEGVRSIAPLGTWGVMFWTVGIILAVAAISGRAAIYVIGLMGALLALGGWCFAIIVQSYVDPEAHLTSGALGFYLLAGTAVLGLALSPQQIEHESKIIGVIGADGEPVALRRVSEIQTKTG